MEGQGTDPNDADLFCPRGRTAGPGYLIGNGLITVLFIRMLQAWSHRYEGGKRRF
jgi:hypothetical protein